MLRSAFLLALIPTIAVAQARPVASAARYRVRIDPVADLFEVRAEFDLAAARDTVLLSLPAWTPGSYDIDNYARWVRNVRAEADGREVAWDKVDKDTWRIVAGGARRVALEFRTNPDSAMLQFSMIESGLAFFNGTNLLVYPEGTNFEFPAELEVVTPAGWRIVTGLPETAPGRFRAANYHDLVDAPVMAGARIWIDSVMVDRRPIRFAIWPDTAMNAVIWDSVSYALRQLATQQNRIFGGPPYDSYTVLFYAPFVEMQWGGGLEHHNSQFDAIAAPFFVANRRTGQLGDFTRPLLSHEFFHLFNVKRIRPSELWPYDYSREQYTPLLWWSEGVTDYYGDVTMARGGLWSVDRFLNSMNGNMAIVEDAGEIVAAEDASTNTWISPVFVDESQYYYPKGALLGLMLDVQIREASNNQRSLDDVMRALWNDYYRRGRGFSTAELLGIIRPWFRGVDDFYARYVNGREPLPYAQILPRGGIAVDIRETRVPFIGVTAGEAKDGGVEIGRIQSGSMAEEAGLRAGDVLMRVGEIPTDNPETFGLAYRRRYGNAEGQPIELTYLRDGQQLTGRGTVKQRIDRTYRLMRDTNAAPGARAILEGIAQAR